MINLSLYRPEQGFRSLRYPEFLGNQHMKVARLSALCIGHLYPLAGDTPGAHLCCRLSRPQGQSAAGRIMSLKILVTPSEIKPAISQLVAQ